MNKIKTLNDLRRMRETMQASLDLREKSNAPDQPVQEAYTASPCTKAQGDGYEILVCGGTGCRASQSAQIMENLQTALEKAGLQDKAKVIRTGCFGFCEKGPIVKIIPDNTFYVQVKPSDATEIIQEHIVNGHKVERLLYVNPETKCAVPDSKHIRFYQM